MGELIWPWGPLVVTGLVLLAGLGAFVRLLVDEAGWLGVAIIFLGPPVVCGLAFVFLSALAEVLGG